VFGGPGRSETVLDGTGEPNGLEATDASVNSDMVAVQEMFHHTPQGIANTRPLQSLPQPITGQITTVDIHRHQRLGGILNEYHYAA
jgi:hypothetical protein